MEKIEINRDLIRSIVRKIFFTSKSIYLIILHTILLNSLIEWKVGGAWTVLVGVELIAIYFYIYCHF